MTRLFILLTILLFFFACDNVQEENMHTNATTSSYSEQISARAFLETFLKSNQHTHKTLSKALQPTPADIKAVFADTAVQNRVISYTERLFEKEKFFIRLFPDYKEVHIWTASVEDFTSGSGDAIDFPSDFLKIIPYLNEKLVFHRFKFVQEGYPAGASYEGLIYVNGHWALFPKIWIVVDEF